MKTIESIMTRNPCYRAGRTITVKGLMLHSVGCSQPSAQVFINNWNTATFKSACVHAFIDGNTGTVYQTLPWNHRGWHGGSGNKGCCNNTHIGVEMCEPKEIKYTTGGRFTCADSAAAKACVKRTYDSAVELFAYLCKLYGLNPLTDICSHKEGCAKGIATNHGDPEHLWTGLGTGYTMDGFRKAVKDKMNGKTETEDLTMTQYEELKGLLNNQSAIISAQEKEIAALKSKIAERTGYYNYIDGNMPGSYKPTIKKLVDKKLLQGNDQGELMLTTDMMRILTILDRTGAFD